MGSLRRRAHYGEFARRVHNGKRAVLPLILLALGVGITLSVYELSSRTRSRIDDYVQALRGAHEAHRVADAHLSNAHRTSGAAVRHVGVLSETLNDMSPHFVQAAQGAHAGAAQIAADASVDHVIAAGVANQQAAQSTVDAGRIAQTGAERRAVADSAVKILERGKRIEEAFSRLGVGQCGVRTFPHVTLQVRDAILEKLHVEGMTVTGDDPWDIDTQLAGVKLRAVWDPRGQVLKLIVTASSFLAPCSAIWERIDGALRGIIGA